MRKCALDQYSLDILVKWALQEKGSIISTLSSLMTCQCFGSQFYIHEMLAYKMSM